EAQRLSGRVELGERRVIDQPVFVLQDGRELRVEARASGIQRGPGEGFRLCLDGGLARDQLVDLGGGETDGIVGRNRQWHAGEQGQCDKDAYVHRELLFVKRSTARCAGRAPRRRRFRLAGRDTMSSATAGRGTKVV